MVHETAVVGKGAVIGEGVEIGPHCVIGDGVSLGDGCVLHSHVVVHGRTRAGKECEFFPFAAVGIKSQDLKYKGEPTFCEIGDGNVFRENVTVHRGTVEEIPTRIGDGNLFLAYAHVAHDCQVGNHCILSNNASLAGHVTVEDHVIVSGMSGVHQFCRLGRHSIIGGMTKVVQDVPPFTIADGNPAALRGLNLVGLKRRGFPDGEIRALKTAYKRLFFRKGGNLAEALEALKGEEAAGNGRVKELVAFVEASERGVMR